MIETVLKLEPDKLIASAGTAMEVVLCFRNEKFSAAVSTAGRDTLIHTWTHLIGASLMERPKPEQLLSACCIAGERIIQDLCSHEPLSKYSHKAQDRREMGNIVGGALFTILRPRDETPVTLDTSMRP